MLQPKTNETGSPDVSEAQSDVGFSKPQRTISKAVMIETLPIEEFCKRFDKDKVKLGEGAFGTVFQVQEQGSSYLRAAKLTQWRTPEQRQNIKRELQALSQCDHPNILKIHCAFEDESRGQIWYVTELLSGGNILQYFSEMDSFSESHLADIFHGIFSAIHYCHSKNIAHRDIKCENILITSNNKDTERVAKLIDFGLSDLSLDRKKIMNKLLGTPQFAAPEIATQGYTEKCDLWSLGVVLYTIVCHEYPF